MTKNQATRSDHEKLIAELQQTNKLMERFTDKRYVFLRGVIRGVGTAIGATIVAGILLWILSGIVNTVDDVPVLKDIIDQTNTKEIINPSQR